MSKWSITSAWIFPFMHEHSEKYFKTAITLDFFVLKLSFFCFYYIVVWSFGSNYFYSDF